MGTKVSQNYRGSRSTYYQEFNEAVDPTSAEEARKLTLQQLFTKQVTSYLDERRASSSSLENNARQAQRLAEYLGAEVESMNAVTRMEMAGFNFETAQDVLLFKSLQAMFSMDLKLDKLARIEAQNIFDAVSDKLSIERFLIEMGTTETQATQEQTLKAERMYLAATGKTFTDIDSQTEIKPGSDGRDMTDSLSVFMALSQTNAAFRNVLASIDFDSLKLAADVSGNSVDAVLEQCPISHWCR